MGRRLDGAAHRRGPAGQVAPARAGRAASAALVRDKVDLILPPWGCHVDFAATALANRFGHPFLAPTALSSRLIEMKMPCLFMQQQPEPMMAALVDMLTANGAKTVGRLRPDHRRGVRARRVGCTAADCAGALSALALGRFVGMCP